MRTRSTRWVGFAAVILALMAVESRASIVSGSFDSSRSLRPFLGGDDSNIRTDLSNPSNVGPGGIVNDSVSFAAATGTLDAAYLGGVDVFFLSEVSTLSAAEVSDLTSFVLGGGSLVLVTNSVASGRVGANAMLQALDGGSIGDPAGGDQGANVGSLVASGAATVGPFGNIVGGTFAASVASTLTHFFVPPATLHGNSNNGILFENFLAATRTPVPEPSTLATACLPILLGSGDALRRRRRAQV